MSDERRNLYRILHVQPEAPLEVIRASYRTLMSTLRAHPDLGGDPDAAARINAAYAVLADPAKRRAYDQALAKARAQLRARAAAAASAAAPGAGGAAAASAQAAAASAAPPPAAASATASAASSAAGSAATHRPLAAQDPAAWLADRVCPFCRRPLPGALHLDSRCSGCDSPLFRRPDMDRGELFGRRRSPRNARPMPLTLRLAGQPGDHPARLRDLSLTGLCVQAAVPAPERSALRVIAHNFDAVAVVVSCRRVADGWQLHGELLTLQLLRSQGVFVSAKA